MVTAAARTNSLGNASTALSDLGVSPAIDQFKIEPSGRGSKPFCAEDQLRARPGEFKLGDLLSGHGDKLEIIARAMFENGESLTRTVYVMVTAKNHIAEVWDSGQRFKVVRGRVYCHRRHSPGAPLERGLDDILGGAS